MACYHPIPAFRGDAGITLGHSVRNNDNAPLQLGCGTCIGCRKAQAKAWALRCHLEYQLHERAAFTTLTYTDEKLPPTLRRRDLQLFLKRLRKRLDPRPLRFFAAGEYGETTHRPHFHALLFGADTNDRALIDEAWRAGYTRTDNITPERIAYCAGYCAKKYTQHRLEPDERVDYTTGEVYHYQPPFLQMSRRPGIGGHARQHFNSWKQYAIHNGDKLAVPRFLRKAWDELASPQQQEHNNFEKYNYILTRQSTEILTRDIHQARLAAGEQIAKSQQALQAQRRKL